MVNSPRSTRNSPLPRPLSPCPPCKHHPTPCLKPSSPSPDRWGCLSTSTSFHHRPPPPARPPAPPARPAPDSPRANLHRAPALRSLYESFIQMPPSSGSIPSVKCAGFPLYLFPPRIPKSPPLAGCRRGWGASPIPVASIKSTQDTLPKIRHSTPTRPAGGQRLRQRAAKSIRCAPALRHLYAAFIQTPTLPVSIPLYSPIFT
jgi:hypothetical protein